MTEEFMKRGAGGSIHLMRPEYEAVDKSGQNTNCRPPPRGEDRQKWFCLCVIVCLSVSEI